MTVEIGYETDFGVISLTTKEILEMPKSHQDFLLASSFIMNDIKFHCNMMTRAPTDAPVGDLKAMQLIRWFWCTRKLASVIFESTNTLGEFCGKIQVLKELAKSTSPIISSENKKSKFFAVAKEFRNASAYHYRSDDLGNELATFNKKAKHRIFAHRQSGNSISELAEQIYTLPTLNRIANQQSLEKFNSWCAQCSGSIMLFCEHATAIVIRQTHPNKSYDVVPINVRNEAESREHRWPLFLVTKGK